MVLDVHALAGEYLANKKQAAILVNRIEKLRRRENSLLNCIPAELSEDEIRVLQVIDGWKQKLIVLERAICRYELAASVVSMRERMILHLHYEKGLSLRQISHMDLRQYSIDQISERTLSRARITLVNKLSEQMIGEKPVFTEDLAAEKTE